jgi:hypothetical protein
MTVEEQLKAALAEVERLRGVVGSQAEDIKGLDETVRNLNETIKGLDETITNLNRTLEWLRRKVFCKMSEKTIPVDPAQLSLFEEYAMTDEECAALAAEVDAAEQALVKTIAVRQKPASSPLDTTGLPVEENHIYPDDTLDG